jgi:choline dehydrogenase-like flavoprotein
MILTPEKLDRDVRRDGADFLIIGSGAAGSVLAYHLAKAGKKVVVLEKGHYYPPEAMRQRELFMSQLISPNTFQPTSGKHTRVAILQGECYGGGTVACDGVTWDLPATVLEDWHRLGLKGYSPENPEIGAIFAELREQLEVNTVPDTHHNPNNQLLKIACERVGLEVHSLDRNVRFCMRCGFCAQGCNYGVKNDSAQTFLKWANELGADVYTDCEVLRIAPGRPEGFTVEAAITAKPKKLGRQERVSGRPAVFQTRRVIVSAGAIGSPRLLLKSGIQARGNAGNRFTLHPTGFVHGLFPDQIIDAFYGINNSVECTHFAYVNRHRSYYDPEIHGFFLEASFSQPWGIANILPGTGPTHLELMHNLRHVAGIQINCKSDNCGRVTLKEMGYDLSAADNRRLIFGTRLAAELLFRVGAAKVWTCIFPEPLLSPQELGKIEKVGYAHKQALLHTGHPFGGCTMGPDPETSVVNEHCECHDTPGLYVCDASVFPSTIGVNPYLSIMMVARRTAKAILAQA